MKAESNIKPAVPFEIIPLNDENVEVLFYENIKTIPPTEEDAEKYSYDYYRLIIRNRENLEMTLGTNLDGWVGIAKGKEMIESVNVPTQTNRIVILEDTINFILGL